MPDDAHARATIVNRLGLHARPAMALVDLASSFPCRVTVNREDSPAECVDAKSIMQVMMLAATQGVVLEFKAEGEGARDAVEALAKLVGTGFDED
ncbi:MAG: HPr family phosphocarrier protein [Phycisphaerales bacterium]